MATVMEHHESMLNFIYLNVAMFQGNLDFKVLLVDLSKKSLLKCDELVNNVEKVKP
jgi:hypothetical protein